MNEDDLDIRRRHEMVDNQIERRGVKDLLVLNAMRKVPRHLFLSEKLHSVAYADEPQPIGYDQTISQPYIVGLMTELLELKGHDRVLEVGTGSGYQTAILAEIAGVVFTIEYVPQLAEKARQRLRELGYINIWCKTGDGYSGWLEHAPYDGIIVTAAPDHIPPALVEQLKIGGRLVLPMGTIEQELFVIRKTEKGITEERVIPVRFVPLRGEATRLRKDIDTSDDLR